MFLFMKLAVLQTLFQNGNLSKQEYIQKMHNRHGALFEYMQFIKNTDIEKIEIKNDLLIFTSRMHKIKMVVDPNDKRTIPLEVLNFGAFEKNEFPMLLRLVKQGDTFFDIGANIGWVSISISKAVKDVKIFAFEPIEETYKKLRNNIRINHVKIIKTFNFGFSDKEEERIFYYNPENTGATSLANILMNKNVRQVKCQLKTLDNFVADHNKKIDFIKCDVEGAEILIFKGGLKAIEKHKPIMLTEMLRKWTAKFNYHPNDTIALLKKMGYNCYAVHQNKLVPFRKIDENTLQTNFFFLHSKKHADKISQYIKV